MLENSKKIQKNFEKTSNNRDENDHIINESTTQSAVSHKNEQLSPKMEKKNSDSYEALESPKDISLNSLNYPHNISEISEKINKTKISLDAEVFQAESQGIVIDQTDNLPDFDVGNESPEESN